MLHCRKVESKQEQFRYCLRVLYTILTESIAIDFVSAIICGGCIALNTVGYILHSLSLSISVQDIAQK